MQGFGNWLGRVLEATDRGGDAWIAQDYPALTETIRVGDVLLVEGRARISTAIKYLTQSTWSHAALCVAEASDAEGPALVEVTLQHGCHRVPLEKYRGYNTRICRPAGLSMEERADLARFMTERIGYTYDMRNILDLARYLLPTPPVPQRFRRRMLALGSGDPTRAICSTLIAQAFQSVNYPVLPKIRTEPRKGHTGYSAREIWHIRHHSLYVPRDFDISPWFAVVKPTLARGFDHRRIHWAKEPEPLPGTREPRSPKAGPEGSNPANELGYNNTAKINH